MTEFVVHQDRVTRKISVRMEAGSVPDLNATQEGKGRIIQHLRPTGMEIVIIDNDLRSVEIYGPLVLKSGEPSGTVGRSWKYVSVHPAKHHDVDRDLPGWAKEVVARVMNTD